VLLKKKTSIIELLENIETYKELVSFCTRTFKEIIYLNNQFINLDLKRENDIELMYSFFLDSMKNALSKNKSIMSLEKSIMYVLKDHFINHKDFAINLLNEYDESFLTQKFVCEEYYPELQMNLLDINPNSIKEPVLDLGCGKSGILVNFLNSNCIDAYGIDRLVEENSKLIESDWFNFEFKKDYWGTIISHMSFSNHFNFNHHYKYGNVEEFAKKYMEIISSLKIGGSFFYTPDLPFIEKYLSLPKYRVTKKHINVKGNIYSVRIDKIA